MASPSPHHCHHAACVANRPRTPKAYASPNPLGNIRPPNHGANPHKMAASCLPARTDEGRRSLQRQPKATNGDEHTFGWMSTAGYNGIARITATLPCGMAQCPTDALHVVDQGVRRCQPRSGLPLAGHNKHQSWRRRLAW